MGSPRETEQKMFRAEDSKARRCSQESVCWKSSVLIMWRQAMELNISFISPYCCVFSHLAEDVKKIDQDFGLSAQKQQREYGIKFLQ